MGLRFRRSKKIGPLRINLSGSGVGWSVGGKRFRYTRPAKGKAYTTTTIPGTGISSRNTVQPFAQDSDPIRTGPTSAAPPERRRPWPLLLALAVCAVIVFVIVIWPGVSSALRGRSEKSAISSGSADVSADDYSGFRSADFAAAVGDPAEYANMEIMISGMVLNVFSDAQTQEFALSDGENYEQFWICSYYAPADGDMYVIPGDRLTAYGQYDGLRTMDGAYGIDHAVPYVYVTHVQFDTLSDPSVSPEYPASTLSAPEAAEVTAPANTAPGSDAPSGIVPLSPDAPAETTLEEWFASVRNRTNRSLSDPDEENSTLDEWFAEAEAEAADTAQWYTVNTATKKIHYDWCGEIKKIKPENIDYTDAPASLIAEGYTWCQKCHP